MGAVQGGRLNGGPLMGDSLRIDGLTVRFGAVTALDRLELSVRRGELFVLLGGSGSGKTTLLRAVGGFARPDAGSIGLDGVDLTRMPPYRRPINTVFQSGALFPHLSVASNIGFGPRQRGMKRRAVEARVNELLALVRLEGYGARRPHELSGGQQQRVALARGLAAEPALLLLDEPLSALDRGLRAATADELVRLQKRLGTTFVLVTHDQQEALTMGDRIGVMRGGRMAQVGTPREVYQSPANRFVAEFMGVGNLWEGLVLEDGLTFAPHGFGATIRLPDRAAPGPAVLGVRAERIQPRIVAGENQMEGVVERTIYAGDTVTHSVRVGNGIAALSAEPAHAGTTPEGTVTLSFPPSACMIFEP
jgi:ABC-type Fe3+/spermidine/putrescine transport system ATPase subunit